LVASGIGSVAYSTLLYKMPPSFLGALTPGFFVFYVRPYNRWGPYAIGLFTGWLLLTPCVKVKTWVQKDWKRGLFVSTLGFSLALLIMLTAIYYLYGELSGSASPITVQQSAAYNALIRVVWSIALAIIVMLCANGLAGPINAFLSWDLFVKFGRITFGVYLVHPIVLLVLFGSALQPAIIENLSMVRSHFLKLKKNCQLHWLPGPICECQFCTLTGHRKSTTGVCEMLLSLHLREKLIQRETITPHNPYPFTLILKRNVFNNAPNLPNNLTQQTGKASGRHWDGIEFAAVK
uniref:Acyl_transf_3 domain-containing protein n=1 Tax=Schistocephalus solidus TaxID=70667 RepID=A0A183TFK4_SCHSO